MQNHENEVVLGIDLGTTYCCVGAIINGRVEVLHNLYNESKLTPSTILFNKDGSQIIGEYAKAFCFEEAKNTIFDVKRILGRTWSDPKLQQDRAAWPFQITRNGNIPAIIAQGVEYHPEQISAKLLKHLKAEAEKVVGRPTSKAVITVPAYFSDFQRQATIDAALIANIDVMEILNEPTAAAIAYNVRRYSKVAKKALVFDLGGGTFDVAIIEIDENNINVISIDGDTNLGGQDFDRNLVDHFINEFRVDYAIDIKAEANSKDILVRDRALSEIARIRNASEKAKRVLSHATETRLEIDTIRGHPIRFELDSELFNELNDSLFQRTLEITQRALNSAHLYPEDIQDVVMVGGSTRIPKIKELVGSYFPRSNMNFNVNPDEAVAYGAAIRAGQLLQSDAVNLDVRISDIIPMSFGTDSVNDNYVVLLAKGSHFPCNVTKRYRTVGSQQTVAKIGIFQGDHGQASQNEFLGNILLTNLPTKPEGEEYIDVHMKLSNVGILTVEAEVVSSKERKHLMVDFKRRRRHSLDIDALRESEKSNKISNRPLVSEQPLFRTRRAR